MPTMTDTPETATPSSTASTPANTTTAGTGTSMSGTTSASGTSAPAPMPRRNPLSAFWNDSPLSLMRSLMDDMDRMMQGFGLGSRPGNPTGSGLTPPSGLSQGLAAAPSFWAPQLEVTRRGDRLVVCADVPGLRREDIQVEVRDNQLVLQGERRQEYEGSPDGIYRSERSYGRFYRVVPLPEGVDASQAQATFKDGVLEISLPLPQQPESRTQRIEIR